MTQTDTPRFAVAFATRSGSEKREPLAVLWDLIESYEVDIFSVSLSRITADFLHFIATTPIALEELAEFTALAARLLLYKSRMLLPNAPVAIDAEPDRLPLELVEILLEYKKMQQAAEQMRLLEERSQLRLVREPIWSQFEQDVDFLEVDLLSFLKAFRDFLERKDREQPLYIEGESVSVEEMMDYMLSRLAGTNEASFFRSITGFSLLRIVACFLALLELARLGKIVLRQTEWLGDIHFAPPPEVSAQGKLPFAEP
ncbi:MAG: segregation/condensation protein A [Turneriella sp.]|nr:segregation/condensation protein A [Leptospiraceae bacterium]MCX7633656.1 segregation/condensation protein A [Turneriella sp.]